MKKTSFLKRIFASIITVATVTTLATASLNQSAFAEDYSGSYDSTLTLSDGDTVGLSEQAIIVTGTDENGIYVGDGLATGSISVKATGDAGYGVYLLSTATSTSVTSITNSSFAGYTSGIYIKGANTSTKTVTIDSISDVTIEDTDGTGLYAYYANIGDISNVTIEDVGGDGITLSRCNIESISNVAVTNTDSRGLYISYYGTLTSIDNVTVTNAGNDGLYVSAYLSSSTIDSITNITVNGASNEGLDLDANVTTISDCYFADCNSGAIAIGSLIDVGRIENVVIENCGSYGIKVGLSTSSYYPSSVGVIDNVTITSSSTASNTGGIYVTGYSSIGLVSNSNISGGYYGIYNADAVSNCIISGNTTGLYSINEISDTTITNCTTGIYNSYSLSNVSVTDCTSALRSTSTSPTFNFLGENILEGSSYAIYNASYGFTLTSLDADGNLANATVDLTGNLTASTSYAITFDSGNYTLNGGSSITSGSLNINEDASLSLTGDINFSIKDNYVSNNGTLTLTSGTLSTLIQGDGEIVIAEGGSVSANADYIDNVVSNKGTLTLTGGTLISNITNLGTLAVDASYLGDSYIDNSQGTISLTGGTIETSAIGELSGTIEIASGATVSSNAFYLDEALSNYGTLSLTGGTLETSLASIGGTIEVATGAELSSSASYIDSALSNKGTLTLTGTSDLNGSISNSGTILADAAYLGSEDITNTAGSIFGITGGTIESSLASVGASVQITDGAEVSSSAANIDTALTNEGTLSLTSGTLGAAITGEGSTVIAADNSVSADAAYLGTALTNNGTLSLTGGTLSSDISMAEGASLSTTEAVTLASGASVSSSSITLTGTGDGTTANIEDWSGDSISNATISKASVTISSSSVDATTQAVAFSLVRTGAADETVTPEGASFTGTDFVDTSFIMEDGSTLTLTNVSLDADCSIVVNSGDSASIDATNLSLSTSDISMVGNTLTIGTFDVDGLTVNVDGTFTVNLGMSEEDLAAFDAILAVYDSINFVFAGVESYEEVEELKIAILDNSSLDVSEGAAYDLSFTGSDLSGSTDGSLNITISSADIIPEPSTATLSLLALTALLARRKRRASLR